YWCGQNGNLVEEEEGNQGVQYRVAVRRDDATKDNNAWDQRKRAEHCPKQTGCFRIDPLATEKRQYECRGNRPFEHWRRATGFLSRQPIHAPTCPIKRRSQ